MTTPTASSLISSFPEASAIVVLIVGFVIAKLAQKQAGRLMGLLDRLVSRYAISETTVVSPQLTRISQSAVYWILALFTVLVALRILGAGELSNWLDSTLEFVPRVLVGIVIIGIGNVLGVLAGYLISHLSETLEPTSTGPRIVHVIIVLIAVVLGLQHMLIDITFITQLLLIILFVVGGGLSLAFALGAKHYVANIVAQSELERFSVGDRIRIDDVEGEIVEKSNTSIRLDAEEGIVSVPCMRFLQTTVVQLRGDKNDD